jgi:hypothetical protein
MRKLLALLAVLSSAVSLRAADVPTQMTVRGKEIYSQDFLQPLPKYTGKPKGFASGFEGWLIHGTGPESRGGQWKILEGRFQGHENVQVKHPATASYGFLFKNVVIQCELRMEDVPLDKDPAHGAKYRYIQLRTTDDKDYICSVSLSPGGFGIQKDDNDHDGPDKAEPLARKNTPLKPGEWNTVLFEVLGDELTVTVNGHVLTGRHANIARQKHSIMFVAGTEGSVRNLKIWEAAESPDWPMNRAVIAAKQAPVAPAKQPEVKK